MIAPIGQFQGQAAPGQLHSCIALSACILGAIYYRPQAITHQPYLAGKASDGVVR
jgi:hypothetical protein